MMMERPKIIARRFCALCERKVSASATTTTLSCSYANDDVGDSGEGEKDEQADEEEKEGRGKIPHGIWQRQRQLWTTFYAADDLAQSASENRE